MQQGVDTIYARATAPGKAGVAIYRISGPMVAMLASQLVLPALTPRRVVLTAVRAKDGHLIDRGLAILFPGPSSFTGEDVLELHLHGARAVEIDLYGALSQAGARLAEAGEFTLRALQNGRLDLSRVEALADLIDSETIHQKAQALGQYEGNITSHVKDWRGLVLKVLTPLAAQIDFPDEDGVPVAIAAEGVRAIDALIGVLEASLEDAGRARRIREGAMVALIGAPNVGKSSLLNRLAGSEVAIVSRVPGTTRDVVEARLDLGGMLVTLADTAGLQKTSQDPIEIEGMRRSRARAGEADLRLMVIDGSAPGRGRETDVSRETLALLRPGDVVVHNKADLLAAGSGMAMIEGIGAADQCLVSAKTGAGIAGLVAILTARLARGGDSEARQAGGILTRQRHVDAVTEALRALGRARENVATYPELAAEDLRLANRAFDRLVGAIDVEEVLGAIFSSFCIGK